MFWKRNKIHPEKAYVSISLTENTLWEDQACEVDVTRVLNTLDAMNAILRKMEYDVRNDIETLRSRI